MDVDKDPRSPNGKEQAPNSLPSLHGDIPASFPLSPLIIPNPHPTLPLLFHTYTNPHRSRTRTHTEPSKGKRKRVKTIAVLVIQVHVESNLIRSDQIESKRQKIKERRKVKAIEEGGEASRAKAGGKGGRGKNKIAHRAWQSMAGEGRTWGVATGDSSTSSRERGEGVDIKKERGSDRVGEGEGGVGIKREEERGTLREIIPMICRENQEKHAGKHRRPSWSWS